MAEYTIKLSAEEEKALLTDVQSIQAWITNAIKNKARQCIEVVCQAALEEGSKRVEPLGNEDKQAILGELAKRGLFLNNAKQLPRDIQLEIVRRAKVKNDNPVL